MGQLIPVLCEEMVPGDSFKVSNEVVIRMQPLVAPVLHEINAFVHYFFVPYRILWEDWEGFITGGADGQDDSEPPLWMPASVDHTQPGSLWDYFGFPTCSTLPNPSDPTGMLPLQFPLRAYNLIFNEYYRDQNLDNVLNLDHQDLKPHNRRWEKDYFTSALPWQQRGIAPALPITGIGSAVFPGDINAVINQGAAVSPLYRLIRQARPNLML